MERIVEGVSDDNEDRGKSRRALWMMVWLNTRGPFRVERGAGGGMKLPLVRAMEIYEGLELGRWLDVGRVYIVHYVRPFETLFPLHSFSK